MSARLNKQDLATQLVSNGTFTTKVSAIAAIDAVVEAIAANLVAGDSVAIPDFGKFEVYTRQNGMVKPKFIPFKTFKEVVNK